MNGERRELGDRTPWRAFARVRFHEAEGDRGDSLGGAAAWLKRRNFSCENFNAEYINGGKTVCANSMSSFSVNVIIA
jgi:hypothetical protein